MNQQDMNSQAIRDLTKVMTAHNDKCEEQARANVEGFSKLASAVVGLKDDLEEAKRTRETSRKEARDKANKIIGTLIVTVIIPVLVSLANKYIL